MIPGLIVFTRAPRLPHRTASAITRSEFPRLDSWYVKRIFHLVQLKKRKAEKLLDRRRGQCLALFERERRQAMPDCDAITTALPSLAMTLPNTSSTRAGP